jgi:hypothetical protein
LTETDIVAIVHEADLETEGIAADLAVARADTVVQETFRTVAGNWETEACCQPNRATRRRQCAFEVVQRVGGSEIVCIHTDYPHVIDKESWQITSNWSVHCSIF